MDTTIAQNQYISAVEDFQHVPSYFERDTRGEWLFEASVEELVDWYNQGLIGDVDCDLIHQNKNIWHM